MVSQQEKKRKKNKYGENQVQVSAWISEEIYEKIREEQLTIAHVIGLGWRAYNDNPQLIRRVRELEMNMSTLQQAHRRLKEKIYD